jgi:hypothetical protein
MVWGFIVLSLILVGNVLLTVQRQLVIRGTTVSTDSLKNKNEVSDSILKSILK